MHRSTKLLVTAVFLAVGAAVVAPGSGPMLPQPVEAAPLDDLEDRFLTTRPTVGPAFVVHVAGEPAGRILTARTLQGLVNRTSARMYVIDGGDPGAQTLLDRYVARGLVTVAGTGSLDDALARYAQEAAGYVVADPSEPWSVHGASVIASLQGGFVATADQAAALQGLGLAELDDTRGRWPDAATAYLDLAAAYADQLPSKTIAIVRTTDTLWDFVIQQGILPVFGRPSDGDWSTVTTLLDGVPDGSPVYGYVSDTGEEEAVALAALAGTDLTLVPTDTTRNLSFHVAVGADRPRQRAPQPDLTQVEPCAPETLNVVVGVTDGDNLNVPLNHFLRPANWNSPRRGELPLGWSIGPSLAILAPGAWDVYADEATPNDELVAMIGWAYGAPALLSDPGDFYTQSFDLMDELGMTTFWSLGGGLDTAGATYWTAFDRAADAGSGVPRSVLVGYGNATGSAYYSPAGRPAFTSRSVYSETPAQLADHVTTLLATDPTERPLVSFLSATNWSNPVHDLVAALAPFEDQGVRFLTPAEAAACMPEAPEPPPPAERRPGTCLPEDPIVEHGLALISNPIGAEIAREPLPFAPATVVTVDAPDPVSVGDTIEYRADITIDLDALAREMLATRVQPVIEAGYGPELAATGWMAFAFDSLQLPFPAPPRTTATGDPTVAGAPLGVTASWVDDTVVVDVADLAVDTRSTQAPIDITVSWSVAVDPDAPLGHTAQLVSGPLSFGLAVDVGVVLGEFALSGGATAAWSCLPPEEVLAATTVGGRAEPPVQPTTPMPPAPPGTDPSTTTTAPPPATEPAHPGPTTSVPAQPLEPSDPGPLPDPPTVDPPTSGSSSSPSDGLPSTGGAAPAAVPHPGRPGYTG